MWIGVIWYAWASLSSSKVSNRSSWGLPSSLVLVAWELTWTSLIPFLAPLFTSVCTASLSWGLWTWTCSSKCSASKESHSKWAWLDNHSMSMLSLFCTLWSSVLQTKPSRHWHCFLLYWTVFVASWALWTTMALLSARKEALSWFQWEAKAISYCYGLLS